MTSLKTRSHYFHLTSSHVLFQKLYLQMEDLLLEVTQTMLHFFPACHHVAQVTHLKTHVIIINIDNIPLRSRFCSNLFYHNLLKGLTLNLNKNTRRIQKNMQYFGFAYCAQFKPKQCAVCFNSFAEVMLVLCLPKLPDLCCCCCSQFIIK